VHRDEWVGTAQPAAVVNVQRLTEDVDAELRALDRQLQEEFNKKLRPVVAQIAEEEHIGILFQYRQPLIAWVSPAVDVTAKVLARLDAEARESSRAKTSGA